MHRLLAVVNPVAVFFMVYAFHVQLYFGSVDILERGVYQTSSGLNLAIIT